MGSDFSNTYNYTEGSQFPRATTPKCFTEPEWATYVKAAAESGALSKGELVWSPCMDCVPDYRMWMEATYRCEPPLAIQLGTKAVAARRQLDSGAK